MNCSVLQVCEQSGVLWAVYGLKSLVGSIY